MRMSRLEFLELLKRAVEVDGGVWSDAEDGMSDEEGDYQAAARAAREVGLPVTLEKGDPVVVAIVEHRNQDGPWGEDSQRASTMIIDLLVATERAWVHVCYLYMRPPDPEKAKRALQMHVEDLELDVRTFNCMKNIPVTFVWELVQKTEWELLQRVRGFGRRSVGKIKEALADYGLRLGMLPSEVNELLAGRLTD